MCTNEVFYIRRASVVAVPHQQGDTVVEREIFARSLRAGDNGRVRFPGLIRMYDTVANNMQPSIEVRVMLEVLETLYGM